MNVKKSVHSNLIFATIAAILLGALAVYTLTKNERDTWKWVSKNGNVSRIMAHYYIIAGSNDAYSPSEGLVGYRKANQVGFRDVSAKVIITPQFDDAGPFREGRAFVRVGSQFGFIDRTGKWIITLPQDCSAVCSFREGLAAVARGGEVTNPDKHETAENAKWGFVDLNGKFVIPAEFCVDTWGQGYLVEHTPRLHFVDGLAAVAIGDDATRKYGFIDKSGNWVVKPRFKAAKDFCDGHAEVCIGTIGFSKTEWDRQSKMAPNMSRNAQFLMFQKQFGLIGKPRPLIHLLLGEPNQTNGDTRDLHSQYGQSR